MMKLSIIPEPQKTVLKEGHFSTTTLFQQKAELMLPSNDFRLSYHVKRLFKSVKQITSPIYMLSVGDMSSGLSNQLEENKFDAYCLEISPKNLRISAYTARGLFYGIVTLEKLAEQYTENLPCLTITDYADMELRCDYWDLRSIHPTYERLMSHIPTLSRAKLNAIVVEYEDKLVIENPFNVENLFWTFSEDEFNNFRNLCELWFLEIIPLQQSFGHLEYVLKDKRYTYLCETPLAVGDLCPQKPQSAEISHELIRKMAQRHPSSRFLHIGCDEVWSLCSCEECKATGKTPAAIFIEFVNGIIKAAVSEGKTPLLWHDMFEQATLEELKQLDKRAIACIWMYNGNDLPARATDLIKKLNVAGIKYFACPAVRAWDCDDKQNYPVMAERMNNLRLWHETIKAHNIKGIINTNWAACFALGKPYGIYETSFFPLFYSAERSWNQSCNEQSFLDRFLMDYHGYSGGAELMARGFKNEDYFVLLERLAGKLKKNNDIAELVAILRKFELCTRRHFPLSVVLYRQEFFNTSDEIGSLRSKYLVVKETLEKLTPIMENELGKYLAPYAVKQFIRSRLLAEELIIQKAEEYLTK